MVAVLFVKFVTAFNAALQVIKVVVVVVVGLVVVVVVGPLQLKKLPVVYVILLQICDGGVIAVI